ncbi:MAG: C4-dicarboxylate ABC transporter substrate-binding protein, partial [Boseongicola sp. SB0670_bin_30]|nr:C4-dicarboxylate ABC transporter substrate-binding protein [Boseongicola sp. SB0670_bin_30]
MLKNCSAAVLAVTAALTASATSAQVNLTSNTAGAGTAVGLTATALVEYAADRGIANIQLKDGQTGTNYVLALAEGKIDIASGPFMLPFLLSRGAGHYASLGKEQGAELGGNIRLLYPYTLSIFTMYAFDAKGVTGWDDLKGRKVLNGPPRGAAVTNSRALIQLFGGLKVDKDYESVTVNWNQAASAIIDGTADVAVIPAVFPGPRVSQAGAAGAMTMFSLPKDIYVTEPAQKLLNKPGSVAFETPLADVQAGLGDGWTVVSEDGMFRGMAVTGGDFANKNMDEELAYQLAKAHIENLDNHKAIAPFMA